MQIELEDKQVDLLLEIIDVAYEAVNTCPKECLKGDSELFKSASIGKLFEVIIKQKQSNDEGTNRLLRDIMVNSNYSS